MLQKGSDDKSLPAKIIAWHKSDTMPVDNSMKDTFTTQLVSQG